MKMFFTCAGGLISLIIVILGLIWIVQGNEFFLYKFFGIKTENVRREIFEQSRAFNEGMVQEIQNMQFEYVKASPSQKEALASIILHRTADVDLTKFPPDTASFVRQLREQHLNQGGQ